MRSAAAIRADVILGGMAGLIGVKKAVTAWNYLAKLYTRARASRRTSTASRRIPTASG